MNKNENFSDRLNFYKQQNESSRLADMASREQKQREEKENERLKQIQERKKITETVAKTKEIFNGTGILETFQEIIDKKILLFAHINEITYKRTLFDGNKRFVVQKEIPAKIGFHINQIDLMYDAEFVSGGEYDPDYYTCSRICVIKNKESEFKLTLPHYGKNELIKDKVMSADETINKIADYIASYNFSNEQNPHITPKTFDWDTAPSSYGSSLKTFFKSCDKESGIFENN